jgi:zinc protease
MALRAALLIGLWMAFAGCRGQVASELGVNFKLDERSLSNGLKVIMIEDHTVPIVSYQTWYQVGSVDEKVGRTGLAHLFEHLMFKGTQKYGAKQFFEQLEAKGAEVNAFTTRDYTVYYENFVPQLLERVVDMEADRMANLLLDDDILKTERLVVMEERRLRTESSPDGRMQEALWELAYQFHPYRWPVIGYPADLMATEVEDLKSFYSTFYTPENAAVVIVGDINPDKTFEMIKKFYSPLTSRKRPKRKVPREPEQKEERRLTLYDHVAAERFTRAYHVTSATDDDSFALDVLSNIMFEGSSSRAYRRLVEDKNLAVGISGSAYTPTYSGLFIMSATMKGNLSVAKAEEELDRLIAEMQENDVSEQEIAVAVKQLTVELIDSVRTPHGLGQLIGTVQSILGDPKKFEEDLVKYTKVRASDVRRVAQKYLTPNNRSVVVMLPKPQAPAAPVTTPKTKKGGKKI